MKAKTIRKISMQILLFMLFPAVLWAWQGSVVGVTDGDTIKVMRNDKVERIRLYGIDCPEKKQAFGKRAKQFTVNMVFKQTVDIKPITIDRYGRIIAWIYVNGRYLNKELLKAGLAWHYKRYSKDRDLADLESQARKKKIGLWIEANPIPPWMFRK